VSRFVIVAGTLAAALMLSMPAGRGPHTALAHPLGNFTINNYDRIQVSDAAIDVYHVLDMAEIPAFQERQKIDSNGDGTVADAEASAYAVAKVDDLRENLHLRINGGPATLTGASHELTFPRGQGGLLLLRLTATYHAELPPDWRTSRPRVEFDDSNYADRLGWREIVVRNGGGAELIGSSVPADDLSHELTQYPTDALSSPLDVRSATFSVGPRDAAAVRVNDDTSRATRNNPDSTLSRFSELIAKNRLTPGVVIAALLAAAGFGALHALSPGHGKTVVGAYLVGSRGTAKHALLLGLVVTATHTSTVYALGFITLYLSDYVVPERLYPWLGVASGALIVTLGLSLFVGRLRSSGLAGEAMSWVRARFARAIRPASPRAVVAAGEAGALLVASALVMRGGAAGSRLNTRRADEHGHHGRRDHGHSHGSGHTHTHVLPAPDEKLNVRQLVGLGVFGGILPCPSAIVVMLSAIALHRVGFGLMLIVAFSLGLAGVLTTIGIAMVYAESIARRVPPLARLSARVRQSQRLTSLALRLLPASAAAAVTAAGAVIVMRAVTQL